MHQLLLLLLILTTCQTQESQTSIHALQCHEPISTGESVARIPTPEGFARVETRQNSFGEWLGKARLKKDNTVYLYNGRQKANQDAQYAVVDIPLGKKDLQQCADVIMRLRAEYLFEQKRYDEIVFRDNNNKAYAWKGKGNKSGFDQYLEIVFSYCNTASLQKQLVPVPAAAGIQPGDIFIKGGFPGHAMIVMDVAVGKNGQKVFMLAQGYMPAQDMHIVKNPTNEAISPWYDTDDDRTITPEWTFYRRQLYRFD